MVKMCEIKKKYKPMEMYFLKKYVHSFSTFRPYYQFSIKETAGVCTVPCTVVQQLVYVQCLVQ